MSVLIKGLTKEKVESCFRFAKDGWCIFDMPEIIEVPTPHGRLIDAEAIPWIEGKDEQDKPIYLLLKFQVEELPTIIESECE